MKKPILIFPAISIALSFMAFGFINWNPAEEEAMEITCANPLVSENYLEELLDTYSMPEFSIDVGPRFITRITKENLSEAKSLVDLVPKKATRGVETFWGTRIVFLTPNGEEITFEKGDGNKLNAAQIHLLESAEYSSSFCIEAYCKRKKPETDKIETQCFVVYVSVIPEKEAEFDSGHESLIRYLRDNSQASMIEVPRDQLRPGKVNFTITKNGTVSNVNIGETSGFYTLDEKMVELITQLPGSWSPAKNASGEPVEQDLVFFFGGDDC